MFAGVAFNLYRYIHAECCLTCVFNNSTWYSYFSSKYIQTFFFNHRSCDGSSMLLVTGRPTKYWRAFVHLPSSSVSSGSWHFIVKTLRRWHAAEMVKESSDLYVCPRKASATMDTMSIHRFNHWNDRSLSRMKTYEYLMILFLFI